MSGDPMTPQQAADEVEATWNLDANTTATRPLRVLVDNARAAAPEGDLPEVARKVAAHLMKFQVVESTERRYLADLLRRAADQCPSVAAPPAPDEVDSDGDEIWERGSHTVTRSGRDVHLSWSGKTLVSDPAGLSAALLAAAAHGTVRDTERAQ